MPSPNFVKKKPESVSVRERLSCTEATMLVILMAYQRVADTADGPFPDAHGFKAKENRRISNRRMSNVEGNSLPAKDRRSVPRLFSFAVSPFTSAVGHWTLNILPSPFSFPFYIRTTGERSRIIQGENQGSTPEKIPPFSRPGSRRKSPPAPGLHRPPRPPRPHPGTAPSARPFFPPRTGGKKAFPESWGC